tara:strand:+ start:16 stop:315 length:300 start_codon:yes stop_codon:yes gene_type:complete
LFFIFCSFLSVCVLISASCALIAPSFNNSDLTSLLNSFIFDDSLSFVTLLLKLESFSEAKFFTAIEGSVIKRLMKNKFFKKNSGFQLVLLANLVYTKTS